MGDSDRPCQASQPSAPTPGRLPSLCQAGGALFPVWGKLTAPTFHLLLPHPLPHTLPQEREKGRRKELLPSPGSNHSCPSLTCPQPLALASFPSPIPQRKLLTPHNAQYHAHFHKYKANRVGQRDTQSAGGSSPHLPGAPFSYSQHLVFRNRTSALHLLSK